MFCWVVVVVVVVIVVVVQHNSFSYFDITLAAYLKTKSVLHKVFLLIYSNWIQTHKRFNRTIIYYDTIMIIDYLLLLQIVCLCHNK